MNSLWVCFGMQRPTTVPSRTLSAANNVVVPLDGAKRYADGLGHRAARPMGGFARRFGAGQRQHFRHDAGRKRSPAGLARLVAQETIDPFLADRCCQRQTAGRLTPA